MKRRVLALVVAPWLVGCSSDPQRVNASMVEIPAQPPQPPPAPAPAPAASPSVARTEDSAEPWAKGLPPASGEIAPAKPVSSVSSGPCAVPYAIDPVTGHRKYKVECFPNAKPAPPPVPFKPAPIKIK